MKNYLKKKNINIFSVIVLIIFIIVMIYCGLNTFIINDDLPYSFFMRGNDRITNVFEIIRNQISDYLTINGRVIIHSVVQFLLIFGKTLYSVLTPIIIVITFIIMKKIIEKISDKKINSSIIYILLILFFLLLKDFNYLIHWVAGGVNYIWTFPLILGYTYFYLKNGIREKILFNSIVIFIFAMLHEITLVYISVLLLVDFINEKIIKKSNLNHYNKYIISLILGSLIIFLSPGNNGRIDMMYPWWNELSLIEKLVKTIPEVSINFLNLSNIYNIIPLVFIIFFLVELKNSKLKNRYIYVIINLLLSVVSFITNSGWIYLLLAISLFFSVIIYNHSEKRNKESIIFISFYAVVFSMILTPEFSCARPNYYMYIWMIIYIVKWIYEFIEENKFKRTFYLVFIFIVTLLLINEVEIYSYIGSIKNERLERIELLKKENGKVLELKEIKEPYAKFHPDANSPENNNYWAYRYFIQYYDLSNDIEIKIIK